MVGLLVHRIAGRRVVGGTGWGTPDRDVEGTMGHAMSAGAH